MGGKLVCGIGVGEFARTYRTLSGSKKNTRAHEAPMVYKITMED